MAQRRLRSAGVADRVRGHHRAGAVAIWTRGFVVRCGTSRVLVGAVVGGDPDHVWAVLKVKDRVRARLTGFGPGGGERRLQAEYGGRWVTGKHIRYRLGHNRIQNAAA